MRRILLAWIGTTDLRAPTEQQVVGVGPIAQALTTRTFDEAYLLSDHPPARVEPFHAWLQAHTPTAVTIVVAKLTGPTHFGEIYEAARRTAELVSSDPAKPATLTFHLSPGTPAMAAVWIILAKTRFPAELIESSRDHGVRAASVPFDISADFIPDLLAERDQRLRAQSAAPSIAAPEFADIIHHSRPMARLVELARRVAFHNVPVIIEGESGTGKEMLARAVHRSSPRAPAPFIAVNCGAIPAELIESQLFGHEKGAFTSADRLHKGLFEAADGGTLFLDELGELPASAQVKLLRVLQEGEVLRVGSTRPIRISVRVIAATHKDLIREVAEGRFREDLFFRLAVALLKVPPLRARDDDLMLLADHLLAQVNRDAESEPGYQHKKLSVAARNLLRRHPWPGNVRELANTLQRAAIWTDGPTITGEDLRDALLPLATAPADLLSRPLGDGFDLRALVAEVVRHYLQRALTDAHGKKAQAAELLGLPSYQTLTNWLKKHGVE